MSSGKSLLKIHRLGAVDYGQTRLLQLGLQQELIENNRCADSQKKELPCHLILCSHPPTLTIGRSGSRNNLLVDDGELEKKGIQVHEIERGGDITFHSPEQLIAYPIIDLNKKLKDVGWFIRGLETVIIDTLAGFSIQGERITGRTGVWVKSKTIHPQKHESSENQIDYSDHKKIASIGIRISRWITLHGISLNVANNDYGFKLINPCGLVGAVTTSMEEESQIQINADTVTDSFLEKFCNAFEFQVA